MKLFGKIFWAILFIFITKQTFAADIVYPIQEMSKPECRFQKYSTLGSDCIQDLPILKTSKYEKYKNDYTTYRRIYTVLWGSSYDYGWDVGSGGHQGVDIATAEGTPVHAMADGTVVKAKYLAGRGNVIKIKHSINGATIYSIYAHLSKIDVEEGDTVETSEVIGEVGSTGNSTGNHLHFQIDITAASGPRYRTECSSDYDTIINSGVCFDELSENTVDPLLFLEEKGTIIQTVYDSSSSYSSTPKTVVKVPEPKTISKEGLMSNEEVLKIEIEGFLDKYDLDIGVDNIGSNIELGVTSTLKVKVQTKYKSKDFNGSFPGKMTFEYDEDALTIYPAGILSIDDGVRELDIVGKKSGLHEINVYIGEVLVDQIKVGVLNLNAGVYPYEAQIEIEDDNIESDIMGGDLYFNSSDGISLIGLPFSGTYYLTSEDKTIKFCAKTATSIANIETQKESDCDEFLFTHELYFDYSTTYKGYLVFNYKLTGDEKTKILVKKTNGTTIGFVNVYPESAKDLRTSDTYYDEISDLGGKGIIAGSSRGYYMEDRALTFLDALAYIRNTLAYQKTLCTNTTCKTTINKKISILKKYNLSKFSKIELTRYQFTAMVKIFITGESKSYTTLNFRDTSEKENKIVNSVFKGNTWKDKYGKSKYFQPSLTITRGEAAYVIYNYIN